MDKLPTWAWCAIMIVALTVGFFDLVDDQTVLFFAGLGVAVYLGIKIDEAKTEVTELKSRLSEAESRIESLWLRR